jgi:signal transduction histidine kinase
MSHTANQPSPNSELLAGAATLCALPDGIVLCDRAGIVRFINPAAARMLEIDADLSVGTPITDLPGGVALQQGGTIQRVSLDTPHRDERVLHVQVSAIHSAEDVRKQIGSVVAYRDVSREVRRERDLISALSYEFRSQLSSIQASTRLLRLLLEGTLTEQHLQIVAIAERNSSNLLGVLNGLLDLYRLEAGLVRLRREQVDIAALIHEVAGGLENQVAKGNLALTIELAEQLPAVLADYRLVHQMVFNLLDNACKFTLPDGRVEVRARATDGQLYVDVQDTGVGISTSAQPWIFKPFFRAYNPLRDEVGGYGLGLAIARQIIELHSGRIWFESSEGQGSTFSFTLPLGEPA